MTALQLGLLGCPVGRSLSPAIHAAALAALGLAHRYTAIEVPTAAALTGRLGELRRGALHGANVTMPYKRAVLDQVDVVAPCAASVGAANVLYRDAAGRLVADNTDADALVRDLSELGLVARRTRALILGAGGAALAAIEACKRLGYAQIVVTSRSWSSSEAQRRSASAAQVRLRGAGTASWPSAALTAGGAWSELVEGADLILQATSAGMSGQGSGEDVATLVPWSRAAPGAAAYDLVYRPLVTPFVARARAAGVRAEGGLGMLIHQAARSLERWVGEAAPPSVMRRAALAALQGTASHDA